MLTLPAVLAATGGVLWTPGGNLTANPIPDASPGSQPHLGDSSPGRLSGAVLAPETRTLTFEKVIYDSREVSPGSLFVALPGEITDGHNYISDAVANGATGCMVRHDRIAHTPGP